MQQILKLCESVFYLFNVKEKYMEYLKILGPSLLVLLGGVITWFLKSKSDELQLFQEKVIEQRRKFYLEIIDPITKIMSRDEIKSKQALKQIVSYEYKKSFFQLNFWGSDAVIIALNDYMQYLYRSETEEIDGKVTFDLFGRFLLEIRKDLLNNKSKLKNKDMLRAMIKDIDKYL